MDEQIQFIKNLKGFSGCELKIYSCNGEYFVRKISASEEYNERLKKQMLKQKYFIKNMANNKISAPKILDGGFIGKLFFFDMEYIRGVNLIDYIAEAGVEDLFEISNDLCNLICAMRQSGEEIILNDFSFKINQKIRDIEANALKNIWIPRETIENLKKLFSETDLPKNLKQTFCHGDLTMENIIYDKKNKKYYLVDFLDSFIEHYWFDIITLFQDIEGKWYKFKNPDINLNNIIPKMSFINGFLRGHLLKDEKEYIKNHNLLLALKFARILPYAKEEHKDYLIKTINYNIEKHKNNLFEKD